MRTVKDCKYLERVRQLNPVERLEHWIQARESVRINKEAEEEKPWTTDPILRDYRFCNVRREDDKVTRWITKNWRKPNKTEPDLWFAVVVARFINWPDTLETIGYPCPWKPKYAQEMIEDRIVDKEKVWTSAYVVSTNGRKMLKHRYVLDCVLTPLWENRVKLRPKPGTLLQDYVGLLTACNGLKGFMAGQVIADLKHEQPLKAAKDWHRWAISGPGSRRGMNRLKGLPLTKGWKETQWLQQLQDLNEFLGLNHVYNHNQNLQNCLCEYDKYCRVLFGEGTPRSKYPGAK